jgi:hypothetical protein
LAIARDGQPILLTRTSRGLLCLTVDKSLTATISCAALAVVFAPSRLLPFNVQRSATSQLTTHHYNTAISTAHYHPGHPVAASAP